jgi:hypothetical protein
VAALGDLQLVVRRPDHIGAPFDLAMEANKGVRRPDLGQARRFLAIWDFSTTLQRTQQDHERGVSHEPSSKSVDVGAAYGVLDDSAGVLAESFRGLNKIRNVAFLTSRRRTAPRLAPLRSTGCECVS